MVIVPLTSKCIDTEDTCWGYCSSSGTETNRTQWDSYERLIGSQADTSSFKGCGPSRDNRPLVMGHIIINIAVTIYRGILTHHLFALCTCKHKAVWRIVVNGKIGNVGGHINSQSPGPVTTQLSLAIPTWIGKMSTSRSLLWSFQ